MRRCSRGEEVGKVVDDALLVEGNHIDGVGHPVLLRYLLRRLADRDIQVAVVGELPELFLELTQRMPVTRDEH